GEQTDEDPLDHVRLADDDLADLVRDLFDERALARDQLVQRTDVVHGLLGSSKPPGVGRYSSVADLFGAAVRDVDPALVADDGAEQEHEPAPLVAEHIDDENAGEDAGDTEHDLGDSRMHGATYRGDVI